MSRRLPKSTTDETVKDCWQTPHQLFNALDKIFNFSLDAAASDDHHLCDNYFTAEDSALAHSWSERLIASGAKSRNVWCNPPFSNMGGFISKAIEETKDDVGTVLIANWDHSSQWCAQAMEAASEIWLLVGYHNDKDQWRSGRVRFVHPTTGEVARDQPKAQALFIFRNGKIPNSLAKIIPVPLNTVWLDDKIVAEVA